MVSSETCPQIRARQPREIRLDGMSADAPLTSHHSSRLSRQFDRLCDLGALAVELGNIGSHIRNDSLRNDCFFFAV